MTNGRGRSVRAPGLAAWLARVAPRAAEGEAAIAFVSDARIQALNKQSRRKNTATDVLSFPNEDGIAPRSGAAPRTSHIGPRSSGLGPRFLGDIVISIATARRQAREAGHSY